MEKFHLDGAYAASELFAAPLARKSGCALLRCSTHCGNHDVRIPPLRQARLEVITSAAILGNLFAHVESRARRIFTQVIRRGEPA
jgi:hypothetical protein